MRAFIPKEFSVTAFSFSSRKSKARSCPPNQALRHSKRPKPKVLRIFSVRIGQALAAIIQAGDRFVQVVRLPEKDQRNVIRNPECKGMDEWGIRRVMARIRDAAVEFADCQGDHAVLAAINRLTRTDEWCGGRARLRA
jgi:hypothetical protein